MKNIKRFNLLVKNYHSTLLDKYSLKEGSKVDLLNDIGVWHYAVVEEVKHEYNSKNEVNKKGTKIKCRWLYDGTGPMVIGKTNNPFIKVNSLRIQGFKNVCKQYDAFINCCIEPTKQSQTLDQADILMDIEDKYVVPRDNHNSSELLLAFLQRFCKEKGLEHLTTYFYELIPERSVNSFHLDFITQLANICNYFHRNTIITSFTPLIDQYFNKIFTLHERSPIPELISYQAALKTIDIKKLINRVYGPCSSRRHYMTFLQLILYNNQAVANVKERKLRSEMIDLICANQLMHITIFKLNITPIARDNEYWDWFLDNLKKRINSSLLALTYYINECKNTEIEAKIKAIDPSLITTHILAPMKLILPKKIRKQDIAVLMAIVNYYKNEEDINMFANNFFWEVLNPDAKYPKDLVNKARDYLFLNLENVQFLLFNALEDIKKVYYSY